MPQPPPVVMPVARDHPKAGVQTTAIAPPTIAPPDDEQPLQVLIIDDDDVDRERLRRMLHGGTRTVEVHEAASQADALSLLGEKHRPFDVIFLDFGLNDGDGRELVPTIREGIDPDCPIIAVTGHGDEQIAADSIKAGMTEFLTKRHLSTERVAASLEEGLAWRAYRQELRRAEEELTHRSLHDPLTDLPNRTLFFDRLEQDCVRTRRNGEPFAVVIIDLDRFKEINDSLGHAAGDFVLVTIARRLRAHLREIDTVARLGGDEFALLLQELSSAESAHRLGEKLIGLIEQPIVHGARVLHVGASMGIAMCPDISLDAQVLVASADEAMYEAKRGARKVVLAGNCAAGFPDALDPGTLIEDLEKALARDQVDWHWQPQLDLRSGGVRGFEALVRWSHPRHGDVPADRLIEAIEHSPLLETFTRRSLDKVLGQFASVQDEIAPAGISINVSARMFEHADLAQDVLDAVGRHGVDPERLTIELTETALISNPAQTRQVVEQLRASGIKLSIDDFGAGFTSFRYLGDFVVSEIKIDRSFITSCTRNRFEQSLVKSLVVLCESMGIPLVAEGVETPEAETMLAAFGCHCGQGYGISRPMAFADVLPWLGGRSPARARSA